MYTLVFRKYIDVKSDTLILYVKSFETTFSQDEETQEQRKTAFLTQTFFPDIVPTAFPLELQWCVAMVTKSSRIKRCNRSLRTEQKQESVRPASFCPTNIRPTMSGQSCALLTQGGSVVGGARPISPRRHAVQLVTVPFRRSLFDHDGVLNV